MSNTYSVYGTPVPVDQAGAVLLRWAVLEADFDPETDPEPQVDDILRHVGLGSREDLGQRDTGNWDYTTAGWMGELRRQTLVPPAVDSPYATVEEAKGHLHRLVREARAANEWCYESTNEWLTRFGITDLFLYEEADEAMRKAEADAYVGRVLAAIGGRGDARISGPFAAGLSWDQANQVTNSDYVERRLRADLEAAQAQLRLTQANSSEFKTHARSVLISDYEEHDSALSWLNELLGRIGLDEHSESWFGTVVLEVEVENARTCDEAQDAIQMAISSKDDNVAIESCGRFDIERKQ